jgi:hypothetical protein
LKRAVRSTPVGVIVNRLDMPSAFNVGRLGTSTQPARRRRHA